jgi:hypothetical protein
MLSGSIVEEMQPDCTKRSVELDVVVKQDVMIPPWRLPADSCLLRAGVIKGHCF